MLDNDGSKIVVSVDSDLEELIPDFLDNRRKDIQSIQDALSKGDYDTLTIIGHSMKGSGGGYGFDYITDIGAAIEQAGKEKNDDEIKKWTDELDLYLGRVEVVFE